MQRITLHRGIRVEPGHDADRTASAGYAPFHCTMYSPAS